MFCSSCGKEISGEVKFCSSCGVEIGDEMNPAPSKKPDGTEGTRDQVRLSDVVYPKNPPTSPHVAWWCLLWPGISQIMLGQKAKGIALMVISSAITFLSAGSMTILITIPSIVDAYQVGNVLKAGKPVKAWGFFPS